MIKVGIVGCGSIAKTHAWALSQLPFVKMTAFADVYEDRAQSFSDSYTKGQASVFDNLTDMLINEKPDVLHICTPHYLHVPMALEALKRGVSVFSEKPPAINMEQFDELCELAKTSDATMGFCFQNRYNKTISKANDILSGNTLGAITGARAFVTWRRDENYYETDWKGKLNTEGGGALINQSIHTLDLILQFLGKPNHVEAGISNHHLKEKIEVEDTVEAWMTFEGGKRACFYASTAYATDAPVILEIQCEKGSITIIDKTLMINKQGCGPEIITVDEGQGVGKSYWGNGHLTCIRDYYECMQNGSKFRNDCDGVRTTMETMMRIYDFR